ncbi:MAG: hypothetical protein PHU71_00385 [Candidatus Gracilibacteria bacterium]|nr:hypothetical protein [Candidatus Gracilibacteria bacterium]
MKLIDWHKKGVPDEILSPDLDFPPGPTEASVGNQSHASPPPPEKASGGRDHYGSTKTTRG